MSAKATAVAEPRTATFKERIHAMVAACHSFLFRRVAE
jgi:hypothetical protein